ncbi:MULTISPECIES: tetratricopeptide repeat protein [Acinetobacter]|uniref:Sel1 repeat family protein n=1 Tax=Acinetobacter pollinis TaxID=2605270 RepID=A0ABU6DRD3_9GAMM|nr:MULTISPECIES: tetratricopeptide repeat protein [Acinetobacter]MBF7690710.1 sel1 repeat family protein [Acinetobacter pollinis]MBF7692365.1 sel1 repeat family protein [Acinetobacter pollinis]MBF7698269.1 sel1 repeat family protein [Acinetobacter pollinis]MBF7701018.1 sel1 repeat family protein [Acinetobacter pollinis]MEB5475477.1 sel1 repeat family protein [Acinetobacter pollinis]
MKKFFVSTLLFGLAVLSHADYLTTPQQQPTASSQAARYSTMGFNDLLNEAKAGQAAAQFYVATHYQQGKGIQKDLNQAFAWYKKAADQGIPSAQLNVGRMLADGMGTSKNMILARTYLEKAASHGDNRASFNLALMEEQKKDYMGAYQWYELSTRDGMLDNKVINMSENKKTALAANLTPDQIRQAVDRADKWIQAQ